MLAEQGILDMLDVIPRKVVNVVPQLVIPLKTALNTRIRPVVIKALRVLQALAQCDAPPKGDGIIGEALVPYYRQLLPVLNLFIRQDNNVGDAMTYSSRTSTMPLGPLCEETLGILEAHGGVDAFVNIKYQVPTYQSTIFI